MSNISHVLLVQPCLDRRIRITSMTETFVSLLIDFLQSLFRFVLIFGFNLGVRQIVIFITAPGLRRSVLDVGWRF